MTESGLILVTGATGFVGKWTMVQTAESVLRLGLLKPQRR